MGIGGKILTAQNQLGRNEPCPCGSGKKYKKCCLIKAEAIRDANYEYEAHLRFRQLISKRLMNIAHKKCQGILEDEVTSYIASIPFIHQDIFDWLFDSGAGRSFLYKMLNPIIIFTYPFFSHKFLWRYCLEDSKEIFDQFELKFLNSINDSVFGFFRVKEIFKDKGLTHIEDVYTRRVYKLLDKGVSDSSIEHDIFSGILVPFNEEHHFLEGGSPIKMPPSFKEDLKDIVDLFYKSACKKNPEYKQKGVSGFLKEYGILIYCVPIIYYYRVTHAPPPEIRTTDGEKIVFITETYEHSGRQSTKEIMAKLRGFHLDEETQDSDGFVWLNSEDTVLGRVTITDDRLTFETNSKERLRKWRQRIKNFDIQQLHTDEKPLEDVMDEPHQALSENESDIPDDVIKQIAMEHWTKYYDNWVVSSLPILDGMTPMEAIKTKAGKQRVRALIDDFENKNMTAIKNNSAGNIMPFFNADELRKRLSLK